MKLNYKNIISKLKEIGREDLYILTAVNGHNFLVNFLDTLKPKINNVIEIGTGNGISTAVFASRANTVYTFDINRRDAEFIWNLLEIRHKISSHILSNQEQIDIDMEIVARESGLIFDFAFIDGEHGKNVKDDFRLVRFCKRVLFHNINMWQVHKFVVEELGAKTLDPNGVWAYWEKEN